MPEAFKTVKSHTSSIPFDSEMEYPSDDELTAWIILYICA